MVASVMLFLLVACGGSDASESDAPTATASAESTQSMAVPTTAALTETESSGDTKTSETTQASATVTESAAATADLVKPSATTGTNESSFAFGWNVGTRGDAEADAHNQRTGEMVRDSGFGWVRF